MELLGIKQNCPKCGVVGHQQKKGYNRSGTQRCICAACGGTYTLNPKSRAYSEEVRRTALRIYYSGVSGRGVGKILKMNHANVVNWIKKTERGVDKPEDKV